MHITLHTFGVLKDDYPPRVIELAKGSTVADLLSILGPTKLKGFAVSVNLEFTTPAHILHDGDEVGLLPPVSGGAPDDLVLLTREKIPTEKLIAASKAGEDGALLIFEGIVRNNSRGRATQYLDYEAYEEMATKQMRELVAAAHQKFSIRHITLIHRLGRIDIGETSVLILVASAHRAAAYEASRWLIDTLKSTVPIWKREVFADGAEWAPGEPFPGELGIQ